MLALTAPMTAEWIANGLGEFSSHNGHFNARCPAHEDRSPSLTISNGDNGKILVHCHAGCDQETVIAALKIRRLWPQPESKIKPKNSKRRIAATYDYVDPDTGQVRLQVVRYEPKDFRQRRPDGEGGWSWSVPAAHRILFNLPAVKASSKPVLICEGEKDVAALAKIGVVATCNPGGAGKWQDSYTVALAGRDVIILPDNDEAGEKHLDLVGNALAGVAKSVRVLRLPDLPPKGDVSDWLLAGGTRDLLAELLRTADEFVADPQPVHMAADDYSHFVDKNEPYRPLGHNRGTYYYLALNTQQVVPLSAAGHNKSNLLGIASLEYWELSFPFRNGFSVDQASNAMMRSCERQGIFSTEMLRGRGAWFDDGRIVLHLGNVLYVDRTPTSPISIRSRFVYEQALPMRADIDHPAKVEAATGFLDLIRMMPWERDIDALYVAGWCVLAHIGGVLSWRPHIWIVGSKGSGKSHVMSRVIRPVLGDDCQFFVGETTEAGVRQSLGHDALPVLFDEAEGEDTRASDRLQRILALVRQSSSETGGKIIKGTTGGQAMSFNVRSCFAFSSINAGIVQQSDKSRVTVCELKPDKRKYNLEELAAAEARVLTDDFIQQFFARAIRLAPVIRQNAAMFAKAVAVVMGEQRAGDQIGALLAGAWSLTSDDVVTYEQAQEWVGQQDWADQKEQVHGMSDEQALLDYIMEQLINVDRESRSFERAIGELVNEANGSDYGLANAAREALKRHGILAEQGAILVSNTADGVKRLLRGTPWSANWSKVLQRLPGAEATNTVNFGITVRRARAVRVPLQ